MHTALSGAQGRRRGPPYWEGGPVHQKFSCLRSELADIPGFHLLLSSWNRSCRVCALVEQGVREFRRATKGDLIARAGSVRC